MAYLFSGERVTKVENGQMITGTVSRTDDRFVYVQWDHYPVGEQSRELPSKLDKYYED